MKAKSASSVNAPPKGLSAREVELYNAYVSLKASERKLIDQVVAGFEDRSRKDIKKWREAIQKMEDPMQPSRKEYHALVKDLKIDAHYISQVLVRKMSFMSKKFRLVDENGEENPDATRLFQKPWFKKVRQRFVETRMSGTELLEIYELFEGEIEKIKVFPKGRIIPEKKKVLLTEYDFDGTSYDDPKYDRWMIELGDADDPGLMASLAPQIIWKRNSQQAWADFAQLFGMPLRVATTDKSSDKDLNRIEAMLFKMGQAAQAVFPVGTEVKYIENVKTDSYNVYDKQIERCNSEISKAINGVTMISDNGSSKSQAQVHFEIHSLIVEADLSDFEEEVNFDIMWKLQQIGGAYSILNGLTFEFDRTESLNKTDQWKIVNEAATHWEIDPDYVTREFGIPILGPKKTSSENFNNGSGRPANRSPFKVENLLPALPDHACASVKIAMAASPDEYGKLLEELAREVFDKENKAAIPSRLYLEYAKQLQTAFNSGFKERLSALDYTSPDNYKAAMYQANVFKFSAAGTWQDVQNLNKLRREAESFDQFKQLVKSYSGVKANWLLAEYNTSEATAQNAANWLRQQEQKDNYDLQYQTVGDSKVSVPHQLLNGTTAPVDDPIWDIIYPPNRHNCRCEAVQVPKGSAPYTPRDQVATDAVHKAFRRNAGKTNFIFEAAHSYFKEFPEVKNLNRRSFGLEGWEKLDRSGFKAFEAGAINTQEDFVRELQNEANRFDGKGAYYQDFLGRWFKADVNSLKGKFNKPDKVERWSMLPELADIMLNPDEVWMTLDNRKNNKYSSKYLKNYKNSVLVVVAGSEQEGQLNVITWYRLNNLTEDAIGNERKGLLLKNMNR